MFFFLLFRHSLFLCFLHVQNKHAHQGQYLAERKEGETGRDTSETLRQRGSFYRLMGVMVPF